MRATAHKPTEVETATPRAFGVAIALSPEATGGQKSGNAGPKRGFVQADRPSPYDAERFAGKLGFYNTAVFGYLGRAALRPLYFHAYASGCPRERP